MESHPVLERMFVKKIILIFFFNLALFAEDSQSMMESSQSNQPSSPIDLSSIQENPTPQQEELDLSKKPDENLNKNTQKEEIDIPKILPQEEELPEAVQEPDPIKEEANPPIEEITKEEQSTQEESSQTPSIDETNPPSNPEPNPKEKNKQSTQPQDDLHDTNQKTQAPNPNKIPTSPDFFDAKKDQSRETMQRIEYQELRKRIEQCEEKENKNACFDVGMIYYQGRSVDGGQQLNHALYFFDRSCDEKNGLGCYEGGIIEANFKRYNQAFVFLQKSCQSGDLRGCKNLAILYYNGWGIPKNVNIATQIFSSSCQKGDKSSCQKYHLALGNVRKDVRNFIGAKKNYQKGCDLGDQEACDAVKEMDRLQREVYRQNLIQHNAKRKF